ncbi:hypothetical protein [Geodermatophilus sp. DSM 45219]|uniref:hypothetical protein n=1 Tax=Geodermatophilus sp. DSM 45219 TaxID=1881103 RepID=UPI0008863124|nr:hypothetical protein [Geodermatophilus sp. DSM 45219]SDN95956.1 hypothetical protein SAMN05428965_2106 [Geodermatophilus sp. DSM 45219]
MDDGNRSSTARRLRAGAARAALAAVIALVGLLVLPGTASAAWKVEPLLDCHVANADGSRTLVVGYTSHTWGVWRVPHGKKNDLYPSRLQGVQPTAFESGTTHGAFTVRVTAAELRSGARWELEGYVLDFAAAVGSTSPCPPSSELPEEGNGTGPAIALAAAGVVGGVMVHRASRRARALQ